MHCLGLRCTPDLSLQVPRHTHADALTSGHGPVPARFSTAEEVRAGGGDLAYQVDLAIGTTNALLVFMNGTYGPSISLCGQFIDLSPQRASRSGVLESPAAEPSLERRSRR